MTLDVLDDDLRAPGMADVRRLARAKMAGERPGHTLQATALVHEAYLRLVDQRQVDWKNRSQFFGVAAHLMRRILLMHAREHRAAKRGGSAQKISLDETAIFALPLRSMLSMRPRT